MGPGPRSRMFLVAAQAPGPGAQLNIVRGFEVGLVTDSGT